MSGSRSLRFSCAHDVLPPEQTAREGALLARADQGEAHLHVSTLAPAEALSIGRFHRMPTGASDVSLWRRRTGGRAVPAGTGFVIVTLALPHRSALVGDDPSVLAPEQVMNRGVRGLLGALRAGGIDAAYPGLDLVTHERRALAALSFIEVGAPTLFQAILAVSGSLAEGPGLLDRVDPNGMVPFTFLSPEDATSVRAVTSAGVTEWHPSALVDVLAEQYAATYALRPERAERPPLPQPSAHAPAEPPSPPDGPSAQAFGRLGPVEAWVEIDEGRVRRLTLAGDFLAADDTPEALSRAVEGLPADPRALRTALETTVAQPQRYVLGLRPEECIDLLCRSATLAA